VRPASFKERATRKVILNQEGQKLHGEREPLVQDEDFNLLDDSIYTTRAVYSHH
jgi:hypothetical protein